MKEKIILAIARWLLSFIEGWHVHKNRGARKETTESAAPEQAGKEGAEA